MKRSHDKELMDLPGQPQKVLEEDLRNLRVINRYLGGYRSVLGGLERLVQKQKINRFSLLDVGTGSGDIPAAISRWARSKRIRAEIVGLEAEPIIAHLAARLMQQTNPPFIPLLQRLPSTVIPANAGIQWGEEGDFRRPAISVVRADGLAPPFPPCSFNFVLASQLLHHFSEEQIVRALRIWATIAREAIIVSDLVRHPLAYHGIRLITKLFTRNVMTLTDAPLSVQRAFTIPEWRDLFSRADIGPFQIFPVFPFRVMALFSLTG